MKALYGISSRKPINPRLNCSLHNCACRSQNFIWISQKLKLIYFETPKCGCVSIKAALDFGFVFSPLHFATAYLIQTQRYCTEKNDTCGVLTTMHCGAGTYLTPDELNSASLLAASDLVEGKCLSDPVGKFEFMHFFGSPEQAINLFPNYRKFIVVRSPIDRLLSAWNMFYNSGEFMLRQRIFQCKDPAEEKKSFRYFIENLWTCPNHHFDSIGNFVSSEVIVKGNVDVIPLKNLSLYWESLIKEHNFPSLNIYNSAKSYLKIDIDKSELLKNEKLLSYYSEDYELMKMV